MTTPGLDGAEEVYLTGPDDGGWHHTVMRDWVAVCPLIGPTAFRLYAITRSLCIDKRGSVRKLTVSELCQLLPGTDGKPSRPGRLRDAIRELSVVGLFTTPEGGPVTTSSSKNAMDRALRIRINDFPADRETYTGPRSAFAVLDAIRGTGEEDPGWKSNQVSAAGWKTNQPGWESNQLGRKSNQKTPVTSGNAVPKEDFEGRPRKEEGGGDGRRPTTGSGELDGSGSAASGETDPVVEKAKPGELRAVIEAIPQPLAELLARDWPRGLPVAVNQLIEQVLLAEQRTVEELVERMGRRWVVFGYEDDLLCSFGKGIRTSLGVLEELVSTSKCWGNNLDCEDGFDRRTESECPRCAEQREERRADRERRSERPAPVEKPTPVPAPYVPEQRDDAVGINEEQRVLAREVLRGRKRLPR